MLDEPKSEGGGSLRRDRDEVLEAALEAPREADCSLKATRRESLISFHFFDSRQFSKLKIFANFRRLCVMHLDDAKGEFHHISEISEMVGNVKFNAFQMSE